MSIRNLLTIVAALTLAVTSCSKHSTARSHTTQTDLGVIEVVDGETRVYDLGNGQLCTMTPKVSTNGTIVVEMEVKRDGKLLSRPRIQTSPGIPVAIEVGEVNVAFTPVLKK
jgi:hypothetical protein